MKKFLIIFGSFILFLITWGTLFKLLHWPGAGPLLVLGMSLFSFFFLPVFFIQRIIENRAALNIITNIFGFISTSSLFTGVMFKVMHWPGAGPMILLGAFVFIFPTLILYIIQQFKNERKFSEFWRTVTIAILVCVFLTFWGKNVTRNILYGFLKVEDATLETNKNLTEYNVFILNEIKQKPVSDPAYFNTAENIHNQTMDMVVYVEDIKKELIMRSELNPNTDINHWDIGQKDNYDIPTYYLGTAECAKGKELHGRLNEFKVTLKDQIQKLPFANAEIIDGLDDFGIKTEDSVAEMMDVSSMKWNEAMFYDQTIVGALSLLSGIQNELLNAEFKSLKVISMNLK